MMMSMQSLASRLRVDRREAARLVVGAAMLAAFPEAQAIAGIEREPSMKTICFIRYQIDPFQKEAFRTYATNWAQIIPRCGGHLVGYFLPDEGTNDVAWGLIAFDSLAAYEAYRRHLRIDKESLANFQFAQSRRLILREERSFLEIVPETFEIGASPA